MRRWAFVIGALGLAACSTTQADGWSEQEWALLQSLSLAALPQAADGPPSALTEAEKLGRDLFFDVRLSKTRGIACASCHRPDKYFTDGRARSLGLSELQRNAPTLVGAQHLNYFGWDGRKDSLWAQALAPLESEHEHGLTRREVVSLVLTHYGERYQAIFADPALHDWALDAPMAPSAVTRTFVNVGKLLAVYMQQLQPTTSPFDAYVAAVRAGDPLGGKHLSQAALRGLKAFIGPARCVTCHNGPLLSDREFHNLGLPPVIGVPDSDLGRRKGARLVKDDEFRCGSEVAAEPSPCDELRFLNPEFPGFVGAFKTPTLRNVAHTGPYMHDGQFRTLESVIEFYRTLPGLARSGTRDPLLERLPRDARTSDMVEFLRSLSGPIPAKWRPGRQADDARKFGPLTAKDVAE